MTEGRPVLIVDDDPKMRGSIERMLGASGHFVQSVADGASALAAATAKGQPALLILDRMLPDADGVELLGHLRARGVRSPAIIITAHPTLDTAIEALGMQAPHYLRKPFRAEELLAAVEAALGEASGSPGEAGYLWEALRERHGFDHVMRRNAAVQRAYAAAARVARTLAPVLIEGATGTGKDFLARAIHYMSDRAEKLFVPVNCGSLPDQLLTSELFGHEKGAFTSATQSKKGICEVADGGTLFLDEIGEMSMESQVKLLRFTQDLSFTRLGGTKPIEGDVRLICATNQDLQAAVREGRFREDLYYRLAVLPPHRVERGKRPCCLAGRVRQTLAAGGGQQLPPERLLPLKDLIQRAPVLGRDRRALHAAKLQHPLHRAIRYPAL